METIVLKTPSTEGKIYIGADAVSTRLPALVAGQKNFVVTDSNVYGLYRAWFSRYFPETEIFVLEAGERQKNLTSLCAILTKMTGAGLHRTSKLFAVGGGVVGDIAGLAAALYMRGIAYVQIPTTLLAQVDSSVGGKTAVDLEGVKNVVGAFYQPSEVLIDSTFLSTLPEREIKCGLGEIVKYAALNEDVFRLLSESSSWIEPSFLEYLLSVCVRHKAAVVMRDEKERGERKSLNVGHTTGHAVELCSGLSHGECVLYGMLLETQIAVEKGVCAPLYGEALNALVRRALALPPQEPLSFAETEKIAERALADKKNGDDGKITMAVAAEKGVWKLLSLPFEEYRASLVRAVEKMKCEGQVCNE